MKFSETISFTDYLLMATLFWIYFGVMFVTFGFWIFELIEFIKRRIKK
jgi:hypothetical protein